jgi:hypothetical protein
MRTAPALPREPTSLADAQHARAVSEAGLQAAKAQDPTVRKAAASLRQLRRDNHFADMMTAVFREHRA